MMNQFNIVTYKHILLNDLSIINANNMKKDLFFDINVHNFDKNSMKAVQKFFYKHKLYIKRLKLGFYVLDKKKKYLDLKHSKKSQYFSFMCYLNVEILCFEHLFQTQLRCLLRSNIKSISFFGIRKCFIGLSDEDLKKINFNISKSLSFSDLAFQIGYSKNNIFNNIKTIQVGVFHKIYTKNVLTKRIFSFLTKSKTLVRKSSKRLDMKYKKIDFLDLLK